MSAKLQPFKRFLALFLGAFALYALTAQRGLGWGDSGEFQHWVLDCSDWICGPHFSNAHPLYVAFARLVAGSSPFLVTLVSSFFGALAVGGLYLVTGRRLLTILFGLSQMLWWLACVAEVQTMNLAFTVFETWLLVRYLGSDRRVWLFALAFLAGLHLNCHNLALLALPVYGVLFLCDLRRRVYSVLLAPLLWALGAAPWLKALVVRGPADVLVGRFGGEVAGLLPSNWLITGFNLALAAISFVVLALIWYWDRARTAAAESSARRYLIALFAINGLFFIRYFVNDQATFLLPTLFFAYVLTAHVEIAPTRFGALVGMQLVLPVIAWLVLAQLDVPAWKMHHRYRDDAQYFTLPWKFHDNSADRAAAEFGGVWNGYPEYPKEDQR